MKEIKVFESIGNLVEGAVDIFASSAWDAIDERGRFRVALSGGQSPLPIYESLATEGIRNKIPWAKTWVFWSDERYVAINDERSNAGNAMKRLLKRVAVSPDQIFPVYLKDAGPDVAADEYEALLRRHFESHMPSFDLIMLGCGKDGHTASIFPGSGVLREGKRLVAAVRGDKTGPDRITMTLPLINYARKIIFLVYGSEKASIVREVLEGGGKGRNLPAAEVDPPHGRVQWLLDLEAASLLSQD